MTVQDIIQDRLHDALQPQLIEVENESHLHGGMATESHFKVTLVSSDFEQKSVVNRHRKIYELLSDQLEGSVHALALHLYTPDEWQARQQTSPESPDCRGGSKAQGSR